jgi:hypothetical protein
VPYFVRVGIDNTNSNRMTCKGYFISRSGKDVIVRYGPIDVMRRKYYWVGPRTPMEKIYHCRTEELAKTLYRERRAAQLKPTNSGRYVRLAPRARIRAYVHNPRKRA